MRKFFLVFLCLFVIVSFSISASADEPEETEYFDDDSPSVTTTPAPLVTSAPETEPPLITTVPELAGSVTDSTAFSDQPAFSYPPIIFQFPESSAASEPVEDLPQLDLADQPMTIAVYEGSGLYHIMKQFIGATFDSNQTYNEYQYLYPASVIVAVVLVVLVAKVLFALVDRLL